MTRTYNRYEHGKPEADKAQARARLCLTCRTPFNSEHFGNRMCDPCRVVFHNMTEPGNAGGRKQRK